MTETELANYADSKGVRLDLAYICNTVEEIDAAKEADTMMQYHTYDYHMAKELAPHNPTRHRESFKTVFRAAKDDYERELLLSEWSSLSPLSSDVKYIKSDALRIAIGILLDANIGKKRIKKMIPILTDTLQDEENLK